MKKTIIIITACILVVLLGFFIYEINRPVSRLDGLFGLKLGMTENELKTVVDTACLRNSGGSLAERQTMMHLSKYVVSEGHIVKDITLSFFEGKLYRISIASYNQKTEKLLVETYGMPDVDAVIYAMRGEPEGEDLLPRHVVLDYNWYNRIRGISCSSSFEPCEEDKSYSLVIKKDAIENQVFSEQMSEIWK